MNPWIKNGLTRPETSIYPQFRTTFRYLSHYELQFACTFISSLPHLLYIYFKQNSIFSIYKKKKSNTFWEQISLLISSIVNSQISFTLEEITVAFLVNMRRGSSGNDHELGILRRTNSDTKSDNETIPSNRSAFSGPLGRPKRASKKNARFAADHPRRSNSISGVGGGREDDEYVEITLDIRDDSVAVHSVQQASPGGPQNLEDPELTLLTKKTLESSLNKSSSLSFFVAPPRASRTHHASSAAYSPDALPPPCGGLTALALPPYTLLKVLSSSPPRPPRGQPWKNGLINSLLSPTASYSLPSFGNA